MELFGVMLAMPAAFVASAVYSLVIRAVFRHWPISKVALLCSIGVLTSLALEWVALAAFGPVALQRATYGAFFPCHIVVFFLSIPALANILVIKRGEDRLGSWFAVGAICAALALCVVLTQYGVSEALFGIG